MEEDEGNSSTSEVRKGVETIFSLGIKYADNFFRNDFWNRVMVSDDHIDAE